MKAHLEPELLLFYSLAHTSPIVIVTLFKWTILGFRLLGDAKVNVLKPVIKAPKSPRKQNSKLIVQSRK